MAGGCANCALQFLLHLRRKSDFRFFAGAGAEQGAWKSIGLGLELRIHWWAVKSGLIIGVCDVGAGTREAGGAVRPRNDADYRKPVCAIEYSHFSFFEGASTSSAAHFRTYGNTGSIRAAGKHACSCSRLPRSGTI